MKKGRKNYGIRALGAFPSMTFIGFWCNREINGFSENGLKSF
jgi:hypothetical protein